MIEDARVLQPEFVPRDVVHRDHEVQYLSAVLEPVMDDLSPEPAFIHGPSGSGKTCIAKFIVERLRENMLEVNTQYINTWEDHSRFKALYRVLDGIDQAYDIHRQSTPRDVLVDRLMEYDGPPYVVILDEVDQLQDKGLLYDLYRVPSLTMVLISNDENSVFIDLDDRIRSRLSSCERIRFGLYGSAELTSILADRVKWGLQEYVISDEQISRIAEEAAGDARTAIGILRNAAKHAHQQRLGTITDDLISNAIPETRNEIQQTDIDRLTPHQRVLYDIIDEATNISPRDLYDRYTETVDDPRTNRTIRNYLKKMEHYRLIEATGSTRDRMYSIR